VAILGLLSLVYFVVDLRRNRERGEGAGELLSLSMASVVTLLIVYHRFYDAVLLLFPLALALRGLAGSRAWRPHLVTLALVAVFFVPGSVMLATAAERGLVPGALAGSAVWEHLLLPHQPLALLALCCWLVVMRALMPVGGGASSSRVDGSGED
jgi:hypothetical protein